MLEQMILKQRIIDSVVDDSDYQCVICLELLDKEYKILQKCKYKFCVFCIDRQFEYKFVCLICGEMYGVVIGN